MSDPYAVPDWQRWQVTVTQPWPTPQVAESVVNWRSEAVVAVLVAAYSTVLGGVAGLLWSRVAPKIYLPRAHPRIVDAINGSEGVTKVLLGDDMWFALIGALAAVVAVALLAIVARDSGAGPGGLIGLAVGGVLGSLVAAQLGHVVQQPHLIAVLHTQYRGITSHSLSTVLGFFDFKLRAKVALLAWPLAAVLIDAVVVALRPPRSAPGVSHASR